MASTGDTSSSSFQQISPEKSIHTYITFGTFEHVNGWRRSCKQTFFAISTYYCAINANYFS